MYLLDTHALLWWLADDERLPAQIRAVLEDEEQTIFVSIASAWEMAIKSSIGKLSVPQDLEDVLQKNSFQILPINLNHIRTLEALPNYHRDPFDRMLMAQARAENLVIMTHDSSFKAYECKLMLF